LRGIDRPARFIRALAICALATACTPAAPSCARLGGTPMLEYHLFFGRDIQGRPPLTDAEWAGFAARVVTPNLPDGFTAFDAAGQWQNPVTHRIVREPTKVIIVAVSDTPANAAAITAVEDAYTSQFHQQSVGTSVAPVCAAF
jgi:hypothetical protein